MVLTVKQLASRLAPILPDGDLEGLARQLRHWTLAGILRPIGNIHTGAGKSRKYEETEVFWAAIALELVRWRIPIGVSDGIVKAARELHNLQCLQKHDSTDYVSEATFGRDKIFMWIQMGESSGAPWFVLKVDALDNVAQDVLHQDMTVNSPSFLVINLSTLFAKLRS